MWYPSHMDRSTNYMPPRDQVGDAIAAKVGQQAMAVYKLLAKSGYVQLDPTAGNDDCVDQGTLAWALIRIALVQLRMNYMQSAAKMLFDTEQENVERRYGTTLKAVLDPEFRQTSFAPIPRGPVPPEGLRW